MLASRWSVFCFRGWKSPRGLYNRSRSALSQVSETGCSPRQPGTPPQARNGARWTCWPTALALVPTLSGLPSANAKSQRFSYAISKILPRPLCRNVLEDFCCINFGGFSRGFSWRIFLALFPTKMRRKNPARKSAKKSGGPKIKIREKSVLPKPDPKKSQPWPQTSLERI